MTSPAVLITTKAASLRKRITVPRYDDKFFSPGIRDRGSGVELAACNCFHILQDCSVYEMPQSCQSRKHLTADGFRRISTTGEKQRSKANRTKLWEHPSSRCLHFAQNFVERWFYLVIVCISEASLAC